MVNKSLGWVLLHPLLYVFSLIFPKKKSRWCFGAWFGDKYTDSPKYLFEIANLYHDDIEAYWVTANNEVYNKLRAKGYKVVKFNSLLGLYIQLTSKVFIGCVNSKDFLFSTISFRNIYVQTTHGLPLKKIGNDISLPFLYRIINKLRALLIDNYSYIFSPSKSFDKILLQSLGTKRTKIFRTFPPRCDGFSIPEQKKQAIRERFGVLADEQLILYMPTHRSEGKDINVIFQIYCDLKSKIEFLKDNKIKLILKLHPYDLKYLKLFETNDNIICLTTTDGYIDTYELLASTDALITDYSSVFFEYSLLDKPIYFLTPDLKEYVEKTRGIYFDFNREISSNIESVHELFNCLRLKRNINSNIIAELKQQALHIPLGNISYIVLEGLKNRIFGNQSNG
jgi:CDP-glycerol glycerophosphotransferase